MPTVLLKWSPVFIVRQTTVFNPLICFLLIAVHLSMHIPELIKVSCCVSHTPIITPLLADHAGGKT